MGPSRQALGQHKALPMAPASVALAVKWALTCWGSEGLQAPPAASRAQAGPWAPGSGTGRFPVSRRLRHRWGWGLCHLCMSENLMATSVCVGGGAERDGASELSVVSGKRAAGAWSRLHFRFPICKRAYTGSARGLLLLGPVLPPPAPWSSASHLQALPTHAGLLCASSLPLAMLAPLLELRTPLLQGGTPEPGPREGLWLLQGARAVCVLGTSGPMTLMGQPGCTMVLSPEASSLCERSLGGVCRQGVHAGWCHQQAAPSCVQLEEILEVGETRSSSGRGKPQGGQGVNASGLGQGPGQLGGDEGAQCPQEQGSPE